MATGIEWTDETVNFWKGCTKVSPGCKFCYMYRDMARWKRDGSVISKTGRSNYVKALKWQQPKRIFTNSWSDFALEEADEWRDEAWDIIRRTPQHAWQILTKRPDLLKDRLPADWNGGWPNVWLGVSIENEKHSYRGSMLLQIPAVTRFISYEPLLGPITTIHPGIDWVIIGGESGNEAGKYRYRPTEAEWIYQLIEAYKSTGEAAIFVKQLGTWLAKRGGLKSRHGKDMEEWHEHMRIRDMPAIWENRKHPMLHGAISHGCFLTTSIMNQTTIKPPIPLE